MSRLVAVVLSLALTVAIAAPAAAIPEKNRKSPAETAAYWTPERMKDAKPRERARPGGGGGGAAADWTSFAVPLTGGAYTGADAENGKVFMTIDGVDYVCSGTAVAASQGVNLVWTAGHCVTDGPGHDATNFMFAPGYDNGATPNGRWTFTSLDSTPTWERQGADSFRADVGAARVVNAANPSATFASTIGARPIAFGQGGAGTRIVAIGYPAAKKFSGALQRGCASPFRSWDTVAGVDPMKISCDMTGGSSGGGWFLDGNANGVADPSEPLISVNSYGYSNEKSTMYGPYMAAGGDAQALYGAMR